LKSKILQWERLPMSKKIWMSFVTALVFTGIVAAISLSSGSNALAQSGLTGDWTASLSNKESKDSGKIYLNLQCRDERGGRNQHGQSYDFSELGLTREQVLSGGSAKFSLVREAGRIDFEGTFKDGKGSGTFQFTSNPAFVSSMKSRGFDFEQDYGPSGQRPVEKLFAATTLNVTTALADDLTSAGFDNLKVEDLFKAAIFKVDSNFAREMKASGFPNMGMEELVKARIFKIDAEFVKEVTQMGFEKEPFDSLVKMRIFKVTPEFIAEMRNEGLTGLSIEELVKLQIFKIDSDFIRKAKSEGVPVEVERLVQRRIGIARN
jgi:hypothetical protein